MNKEKIISSYETVFVCDMTNGETGVRALIEKFTGLISSNGSIVSVSEWGKRKLAYPINDLKEGYYVLVTFKAPTDFILELNRIFNITEGILRSLVIKVDDAEKVNTANPAEVVIEDDESENRRPSRRREATVAAPVEEVPAEEAPAEEVPAEEVVAEEVPAEETPAEETPVEETPVEETPVEE